MNYHVVEPKVQVVHLDAYSLPIAILEEVIGLTCYFETPSNVVPYHTATAELTGFVHALADYRKLVYGQSREMPWDNLSYLATIIISFCVKHHWSNKSAEELAKQLLNVIHFYPE